MLSGGYEDKAPLHRTFGGKHVWQAAMKRRRVSQREWNRTSRRMSLAPPSSPSPSPSYLQTNTKQARVTRQLQQNSERLAPNLRTKALNVSRQALEESTPLKQSSHECTTEDTPAADTKDLKVSSRTSFLSFALSLIPPETGQSDSKLSPAELREASSQPLDNITNVFPERLQARIGRKNSRSPLKQSSQECTTEDTPVACAGEGPSISDKESVASSQQHSQENESRGKNKRKRKIVSPETLFRDTKQLCEVPEVNIRRWLAQKKQLLVDIFQRKVYSHRHEMFVTGVKNRAALHWLISTRLFSKEQVDAITSGLMNAFCYKHMNYFSYVMSVIYPECLVRLIMDYHSISFQQAEKMMMGLDEFDTESCKL